MPEFSAATLDGDRRALTPKMVESFRKKLRGELLSSESPGYEAARRVWNGMVDKRPALIARCVETDDVAACVHFAREHQLLVSVRGGGHNYAGKAV